MKIGLARITKILMHNKKVIKVLQGGTSSGKTYSILYRILVGCISEWENETIDVIRDTMPALRISAMKDWEDILKKYGLYNKNMHNRSKNEYTIKSNKVRFYSADNEEKMRGPRRDRTYFNEVLELKRMNVMQVMLRTNKEIFMDYNPSEQFHYIYDEIIPREDVFFHKSTFKDNPFLGRRVIDEIKHLEKTDPNLWRIYGLGERGVAQSTIYPTWHYAVNRARRDIDISEFEGEELFGMDFGFNDPTTFVQVKYHAKGGIMAQERLYKPEMTSDSIVAYLESCVKEGWLNYDSQIIADSARPEIIREIKSAGFNIHPARKEKGSILRGINFIKNHALFVTKDSVNMIKELRSYKWKCDANDRVLDTPIDLNDHLMDALRYALEHKSRKKVNIGIGVVGRGEE
jgi:phage terminase large subunit